MGEEKVDQHTHTRAVYTLCAVLWIFASMAAWTKTANRNVDRARRVQRRPRGLSHRQVLRVVRLLADGQRRAMLRATLIRRRSFDSTLRLTSSETTLPGPDTIEAHERPIVRMQQTGTNTLRGTAVNVSFSYDAIPMRDGQVSTTHLVQGCTAPAMATYSSRISGPRDVATAGGLRGSHHQGHDAGPYLPARAAHSEERGQVLHAPRPPQSRRTSASTGSTSTRRS